MAFEELKKELSKHNINKKNMQIYINSYMSRVDITGKLQQELRCDALLVVGSKSSQCAAAEYMHSHMDKVFNKIFRVYHIFRFVAWYIFERIDYWVQQKISKMGMELPLKVS